MANNRYRYLFNPQTQGADAASVLESVNITNFSGSITDAQHGVRGGGNLHALATTSSAGFMSAQDKIDLNDATTVLWTEVENKPFTTVNTSSGQFIISSDELNLPQDLGSGSNVIFNNQRLSGTLEVTGSSTFNNDITFLTQINSDDYISGILGAGSIFDNEATNGSFIEVDNMRIRESLRTHIFKKDIVRASNGLLYVTDASEIVDTVTTPATTGSSFVLTVQEAVFNTGDDIWYKDADDSGTINSVKANITDNGTSRTLDSKTVYDYSASLSEGTSVQLKAGDTVVRTSGGTILLDASTEFSPFIDIAESGSVKARLGNLDGVSDSIGGQTVEGFGLYSDNAFLKGGIVANYGAIGGFGINATTISSSNDELILRSNGQITGSNVLFDGGVIGGWSITTSSFETVNTGNGSLILDATNYKMVMQSDFGGALKNVMEIGADTTAPTAHEFNSFLNLSFTTSSPGTQFNSTGLTSYQSPIEGDASVVATMDIDYTNTNSQTDINNIWVRLEFRNSSTSETNVVIKEIYDVDEDGLTYPNTATVIGNSETYDEVRVHMVINGEIAGAGDGTEVTNIDITVSNSTININNKGLFINVGGGVTVPLTSLFGSNFSVDSGGDDEDVTLPLFNPLDYGATADGSSDGAALQTTISASVAGNGAVFLPADKTFTVTSSLTLPSNATIIGANKFSSIIQASSSADVDIKVLRNDDFGSGNDNINLINFTVDGNDIGFAEQNSGSVCVEFQKVNQPSLQDMHITRGGIEGVYIYSSSNAIVSNLYTHDNGPFDAEVAYVGDASGIHMDTCKDFQLNGIVSHTNGFHGVLTTNSTDGYIQATVYDNGFQGVYCQLSSDNIVMDVNSHDNFRGVYITDSSNIIVRGTINDCTNGLLTNNSTGVLATSIRSYGHTENDLYLVGSSDEVIWGASNSPLTPVYQKDNAGSTLTIVDDKYVDKSGDTMTGNLVMDGANISLGTDSGSNSDQTLFFNGETARQTNVAGPEHISFQGNDIDKVTLGNWYQNELSARFLITQRGDHEWSGNGVDQNILMGYQSLGKLGVNGVGEGGFSVNPWRFTKLDGAVNASQATMSVDDTSNFQNDIRLRIDDEIMRLETVADGTTIYVERGTEGSTASTHTDNSFVTWLGQPQPFTAIDFQYEGSYAGTPGIIMTNGYSTDTAEINMLAPGQLRFKSKNLSIDYNSTEPYFAFTTESRFYMGDGTNALNNWIGYSSNTISFGTNGVENASINSNGQGEFVGVRSIGSAVEVYNSGVFIADGGFTDWAEGDISGSRQHVDVRVDATTESRLHWFGRNDSNAVTNAKHAFYDGNSYVNFTAEDDGISLGGSLTTTEDIFLGNVLYINSASAGIQFNNSGGSTARFNIQNDETAGLVINRFDDAGSYAGTPFQIMSGSGNILIKNFFDDGSSLRVNGNITGVNSNLTIDGNGSFGGDVDITGNLLVEGGIRASEFVIDQYRSVPTYIMSPGNGRVDAEIFDDGSTEEIRLQDNFGNPANTFAANDIIIVKKLDAASGLLKLMYRRVSYIYSNVLGLVTTGINWDRSDDVGTWAEGDFIVQVGNTSDSTRDHYIQFDVSELDIPAIRIFDGVGNTASGSATGTPSTGSEVVRMGGLDGFNAGTTGSAGFAVQDNAGNLGFYASETKTALVDLDVEGTLLISGSGQITNSGDDFTIDSSGITLLDGAVSGRKIDWVDLADVVQGEVYVDSGIMHLKSDNSIRLTADFDGASPSQYIFADGRLTMPDLNPLRLSRMTETERDNLPGPLEGDVIYNTTTARPNYYDGMNWLNF